jgi:hypothetical protein
VGFSRGLFFFAACNTTSGRGEGEEERKKEGKERKKEEEDELEKRRAGERSEGVAKPSSLGRPRTKRLGR